MNIILLAQNYENYKSGYYHDDIVKAFKRKYNCFVYGKGYPDYEVKDTIEDVIAKSPFKKDDIDLIVVGTSWEIQDPNNPESDPHPNINLSQLKIPKIFFLNKEYKKLQKKFEYIKKNKFGLVISAHPKCEYWSKKLGVPFLKSHFAIDKERFEKLNKLNIPKTYDFGFTGSLHKKYIDIRYKIKCEIFDNPHVKSNLGLSILFKKNPIKSEYRKYKIYWAEWGARSLFGRSLVPTGEGYLKFLRKFKIFLSTPSAKGLVGTRFFEIMASKTLLFIPESEFYNGLFEHGINCCIFKKDLSDFKEKLEYYLFHSKEREKVCENAYQDVIKNHTYENRIEKIINKLKNV